MATATVDHHRHHLLHLNSLPLIDARLLSHSELLSLSLCSSSTSSATTIQYDDEDRDSIPKIDASFFNESAGSRKQTFSRLRLAPRNSSPLPLQIPSPAPVKPLDEEDSQIISLLKSLLNIHSHSSTEITDDVDDDRLIPVPVEFEDSSNTNGNGNIGPQNVPVELVTCSEVKRKRGRPRKDENGSASGYRWVISSENGVNESQRQNDNMMLTLIHENSQYTPAGINSSCETGKRKRGRPRKIKNENENSFNQKLASPVGSSVSSETGKRKRGRPRKIESGVIIKTEMAVVSESSQNISSGVVTCETSKRKRGRPRKDESTRGYGGVGNEPKMETAVREHEREDKKEMATENRNAVVSLANAEDPFWEELRKTEGMEKDNELFGFWRGSNGEW